MPGRKTFTKPAKENLLIKKGQRPNPGEIMAGMKGGEERVGTGRLDGSKRRPDFMPSETLDAEDTAKKRTLIELLTKIITPNSLSSKSTPEQDKRSLVNKLNKSMLKEIKELVPDRIKRMSPEKLQELIENTDLVTDSEQVEIQTLYMDASP